MNKKTNWTGICATENNRNQCNDCGNELLEPYCIDCKSDNVEERE